MNKSQFNKKIYEMSRTMPPLERFKLKLEAINEMERTKKFDIDQIPAVCLQFDNRDEIDQYRALQLDFFIINLLIMPMLSETYYVCVAASLMLPIETEAEKHELATRLLTKITGYFRLVTAIEEFFDKKIGLNLFTYDQQQKLKEQKTALEPINELTSKLILKLNKVNKISDFSADELEPELILIETLFENFHWVAEIKNV